jgi:hypothetical protein
MIMVVPGKHAKGGQWRADAFDVLDRKHVIGRIMRTHLAGHPTIGNLRHPRYN